MNKTNSFNERVTIVKPRVGWQLIDFSELSEYRDLFFFLVRRDIKALYAQTILGFSWAILQPLIQIVVFTIIFGKVAKLSTDGIPYFLFTTVAIIPWTYMSQSMTKSSASLVQGQHLLGKVYFPRIIFPMISIFAKLIDFGISLFIILGVLIFYRIHPTFYLMYLPLLIILMISIPTGIGFWLSALAIRFRDVQIALPFILRLLMYSAPIVYSASSIPHKYRILYSLNPIVGVIEGYRACFLGLDMPWEYIWPGSITAFLLLISGILYFKRMESVFVDVI